MIANSKGSDKRVKQMFTPKVPVLIDYVPDGKFINDKVNVSLEVLLNLLDVRMIEKLKEKGFVTLREKVTFHYSPECETAELWLELPFKILVNRKDGTDSRWTSSILLFSDGETLVITKRMKGKFEKHAVSQNVTFTTVTNILNELCSFTTLDETSVEHVRKMRDDDERVTGVTTQAILGKMKTGGHHHE